MRRIPRAFPALVLLLALAACSDPAAPDAPIRITELPRALSATEREVLISFYLDGQLFTAQAVRVPPGDLAEVVLDELPARPAVYEARLSLPASAGGEAQLDRLPLDDTAFAVYSRLRPGGCCSSPAATSFWSRCSPRSPAAWASARSG